jgi:hypothetical protein
MFSIEYWVNQDYLMIPGKMVKNMITPNPIASNRRVWTSMGEIQYFHKLLGHEVVAS